MKWSNWYKSLLTTVFDLDGSSGLSWWWSESLDFLNNVIACLISYLSENYVFSVQPVTLNSCNEKLRSVCVWSGIGHGQKPWSIVLKLKVFVFEFFSIDRFSSSSVSFSKISSLKHKLRNDSVENWSLKSKSFFSSAESSKVLCCQWNYTLKEFKVNSTKRLSISDTSKKTLAFYVVI
mgnify:CR=1 FL=1